MNGSVESGAGARRMRTAEREAPVRFGMGTVAKIAFLLYLLIILFGMTPPFREQTVLEVEDVGTFSVFNQVAFGVLFLLSAASLVKKRHLVALIVRKERYLTLFLLWCLLSVGWSDYGFVSFKRIFQILTAVSVVLAVLLHGEAAEDAVKYLYVMLAVYVILSLASVAAVPGAIESDQAAWRGMASTKNNLGQIAFAGIIVFSSRAGGGPLRWSALSILLVLLSLVLLAGSRSVTSLLTLSLLAVFMILSACDDRFRTLGLGRTFSLAVLATALGVALSVWRLAPDLVGLLPESVGKDPTLTGRTPMWGDIFREFLKHPLAGCGFGGFWVMENPDLLAFYQDYPFLPQQAHLGYLDILNETGLAGLLLFGLIVLSYFRNLGRYGAARIWTWFLVGGLVINSMETVLFRPKFLIGVLFILSYLAPFANAAKALGKGADT